MRDIAFLYRLFSEIAATLSAVAAGLESPFSWLEEDRILRTSKIQEVTEVDMAAKNKKLDRDDSLAGRCFHVFEGKGLIDRQGIVLARLDAEHYLVQYHEWSTGHASAQQIVTISEMTSSPKQARGPWQWQFYKDDVHMIEWLERNGPKLVSDQSDLADREATTRRQWHWPRRTDGNVVDRNLRVAKVKAG